MRIVQTSMKTAKAAGLAQAETEFTFEVDVDEEKVLESAVAHWKVRLQSRYRAGKITAEQIDGQTIRVSDLYTRSAAVMTPESAQHVLKAQLSTMEPADKVVYLFNCGFLDDDGAAVQLDMLAQTNVIDQEQFDQALEELGA